MKKRPGRWIFRLTGIVTNEMMTVFYASSNDINLRGLVMSGIVISALGAIMDVCISIASATEEIFRVHPEISFKEAFKSIVTELSASSIIKNFSFDVKKKGNRLMDSILTLIKI